MFGHRDGLDGEARSRNAFDTKNYFYKLTSYGW